MRLTKFLPLLLLLCPASPGQAQDSSTDYPINFDSSLSVSRTDRKFSSFTLTATNGGTSTITLDNSGTDYVYRNMLTSQASVCPGDEVSFTLNHAGQKMHVYFYVDYDQDGKFTISLNDDGTPKEDSELLSYTFANGHNSNGETVTWNNVASTSITAPSAITIPTDIEAGMYRARLKVDWNSTDPGGKYSSATGAINNIDSNGGHIVDFILNIHSAAGKLDLVTENGYLVGSGNTGTPDQATFQSALTLLPVASATGYTLSSVTLRHGHNLDGDKTLHGNTQWTEETLTATAGEEFTIPAGSVDGEVRVTANFTNESATYAQAFSDEFDSEDNSLPDTEVWGRQTNGTSTWNRYCASTADGQQETGYIKDGKFVARCLPNTHDDELMRNSSEKKAMISGAINSSGKKTFKYGKFECRAKTNALSGNFPAFWLLPEKGKTWPLSGEIDIWEAIDADNCSYSTIHSNWADNLGNKGTGVNSGTQTSVTAGQWHVYALEWTPTKLTFYVDGKQYFTYSKSETASELASGQWPFNKLPYYLILNQSVGDGKWASAAQTSETYETDFDWVRVYQAPTATVTYNYYVGEELRLTLTNEQPVGEAIDTPEATDYLSVSSYTVENNATTVPEGGVTVTVTATAQELPFQVSTDEKEYWYTIDIHGGTTNSYLWNDGDGSLTAVSTPHKTNGVPDASLWKIQGSQSAGFTLTNKATGKSLTMTESGTCTTAESGSTFQLCSSTNFDDAAAFKLNGSTFYVARTSANALIGSSTDNSNTSCLFRPASFFPNTYYTENFANAATDAPTGALGTLTRNGADATSYVSAAKNAVSTLNSDPFDTDATTSLINANSSLDDCYVAIPNDLSGYYRLVNSSYGTYLSLKSVTDTNKKTYPFSCTLSDTEAMAEPGSVLKLEVVNNSTRYNIYIDGKWMGGTAKSTATSALDALGTEEHAYVFNHTGGGKFTILDNYYSGTHNYLHCSSSQAYGIVGWGTGPNASKWYVIPATELDVKLNAVNGKSYSTAYLPFPVSGASGAGIYTCTLNDAKDALNSTQATGGAPAQTGLLLYNEEAGTSATLTIGDPDDATLTSALSGSLAATTLTDDIRSNYYVLGRGKDTGGIGFYQPASSVSTIPAHRAYFPASELGTASANALRINFPGVVESIHTAEEAAPHTSPVPIYDLSGRRVTRTGKGGIYIQGHRKIFIK